MQLHPVKYIHSRLIQILGRYLFLVLIFSPFSVSAQEVLDCNGVWYKSKRAGAPVYFEDANTSKVIYKLGVGERVCYVGERGDYVILEWKKSKNSNEGLAYVRASDVRVEEVKKKRKTVYQHPRKTLFDRIKQFYYYARSGGVPDDIIGPFRPDFEPAGSIERRPAERTK